MGLQRITLGSRIKPPLLWSQATHITVFFVCTLKNFVKRSRRSFTVLNVFFEQVGEFFHLILIRLVRESPHLPQQLCLTEDVHKRDQVPPSILLRLAGHSVDSPILWCLTTNLTNSRLKAESSGNESGARQLVYIVIRRGSRLIGGALLLDVMSLSVPPSPTTTILTSLGKPEVVRSLHLSEVSSMAAFYRPSRARG